MLIIDAHVHIYDCYTPKKFFDGAYDNFSIIANQLGYRNNFSGALLFSETSSDRWFNRLLAYAKKTTTSHLEGFGSWKFYLTNENDSIYATSTGPKNLLLIAGQQVQTAEGIEVLSLVSKDQFRDGIPISELLNSIIERKGIPVLPWGVGKWIGGRGKIITSLIKKFKDNPIFIGDNSGRPVFWKQPSQYKLAKSLNIPILPGSDPLPFSSQQTRAGSFGFVVNCSINSMEPAKYLKSILLGREAIFQPYGKLESTPKFILNQILMQLIKVRKNRLIQPSNTH